MVVDSGMSTLRASSTGELASRRLCAARLRRLQDSHTTRAGNLIEDSLGTTGAGSTVADLLAVVKATLEWSATIANTNVLCLDGQVGCGQLLLSLRSLSLNRFLLACAAAFATLVSSTVEVRLADTGAEWRLQVSLVAE
jgi:hypothetical protein